MALFEHGYTSKNQSILVSNPREDCVKTTAARAVRSYLSSSNGQSSYTSPGLGHLVGFSLPFLSATSTATRIEYVSSDIMMQETTIDPLLSNRRVLVVDGIHLRETWTDVALGLLQSIIHYRQKNIVKREHNLSDFNLILCISPTCPQLIDILWEFFTINGSQKPSITILNDLTLSVLPSEVYHLNTPISNYLDKCLDVLLTVFSQDYFSLNKKADFQETGRDIIVFVPTRRDVKNLVRLASNELPHRLRENLSLHHSNVIVLPCHEKLSVSEKQDLYNTEYFSDNENNTITWRVIVATNSAENDYALLASRRITCVIDTGLDSVDISSSGAAIRTRPISKSKAEIRRSMAGSGIKGIGKCFRLYRKEYFTQIMPLNDDPQLMTLMSVTGASSSATDINGLLETVILRLFSLQIKSLTTEVNFIPPITLSSNLLQSYSSTSNISHKDSVSKGIDKSLLNLFYAGCIDSKSRLTNIGQLVAQFGSVPISFARAIIASSGIDDLDDLCGGCLYEMVTITAIYLAGGLTKTFVEPSSSSFASDSVSQSSAAAAARLEFQAIEGDAITLLNVFEAYLQRAHPPNLGKNSNLPNVPRWAADKFLNYQTLLRAEGIRTQLVSDAERIGLTKSNILAKNKNQLPLVEKICRSLCKGFFMNAAKRTYVSTDVDLENITNQSRRRNDSGIRYELINASSTILGNQAKNGGGEDTISVRAHGLSVGSMSEFAQRADTRQLFGHLDSPESEFGCPWVVYTGMSEYGQGEWYLESIIPVRREWLVNSRYYKEVRPT